MPVTTSISLSSALPRRRSGFVVDPCVRVVVFLISEDLAEGVSQADEVLLGTRHAQSFVLVSVLGCYHR